MTNIHRLIEISTFKMGVLTSVLITFLVNVLISVEHIFHHNCRLIRTNQGSGAVEYTLAMAITFIMLFGVFELFRAMSINIYTDFAGWICLPYP